MANWFFNDARIFTDGIMGITHIINTYWIDWSVSKMKISNLPISDVMYIIPDDIKAIVLIIFAFLCVLAVWRIIK